MQNNGLLLKDKNVLRSLAARLAELSVLPAEDEKKALWYSLNALKPTRPVIFCDPEVGWGEIITDNSLECEGCLARGFEATLRKELFWAESMRDDRVTEARFVVPYVFDEEWGLRAQRIGGANGGAFRLDPPIKDYTDITKLHFPELKIDYEETTRRYDAANDIFGDLLDVRRAGWWWWSLGLTVNLAGLRGLEQIMYDMYDYPDELHGLMAFLRDGTMAKLDYLEKNNLLTANHDGAYIGSGGFGWTNELPMKDFDGEHIRLKDMWGFGESQETSQISAEMFEEFILPYQIPILERFGINAYGCCEPLNQRWHAIERIPRLRRVSISPWSDVPDMAEKMGSRYIFSLKPKPSYLAQSNLDEDYIRQSLRESLKATRNCRVEVIMKDCTTIGKNPQNVIRWTQIAKEEAQKL